MPPATQAGRLAGRKVPAARSAQAEVRELACKPGRRSIERLAEIAKGDGVAAVAACGVILEWAYGPVPQSIVIGESLAVSV